MKMKIIHFGSYWMGENDIVSLMSRCLSRLPEFEVIAVDPGIYKRNNCDWIQAEGSVNWLKDDALMALVERENPDILICNAGGLSPTPKAHDWLALRGVIRIGIALSDPDDFSVRSRHYAGLFDVFFTNALLSLDDYSKIGVTARLLPFAADAEFHYPINLSHKYDIVVLGGKRPDRVLLVNQLRKVGLRVGCFGSGWIDDVFPFRLISLLLPNWSRRILCHLDWLLEVHGEKHVRTLNLAPVYCSFSMTYAGFINVKVGLFEAAATGCCILVQDFPEVHRYFKPNEEIVTFTSMEDAVLKAQYLRNNLEQAHTIGEAARRRIVIEHTWEHRWRYIMETIGRPIVNPQTQRNEVKS